MQIAHLDNKVLWVQGYSGAELPAQQQRPLGVTEMGYPMYPPSLYRAISYASKLGVPMYITENGCPYLKDDSERTDWINGYLTEVQHNLSVLQREVLQNRLSMLKGQNNARNRSAEVELWRCQWVVLML